MLLIGGENAMLKKVTIQNFLSIREEQTFSLEADRYTYHQDDVFERGLKADKDRVLSVAMIIGPNASGKSNLLKALHLISELVKSSHYDDRQFSNAISFLFDPRSRSEPSTFSIEFYTGDVLYEYMLKITQEYVVEEELSYCPNKRKRVIFYRKRKDDSTYEWKFGGDEKQKHTVFAGATEGNMLYLSVAGNFNCESLKPAYDYFKKSFKVAADNGEWISQTLELFDDSLAAKGTNFNERNAAQLREDIYAHLRALDIDFQIEMISLEAPESLKDASEELQEIMHRDFCLFDKKEGKIKCPIAYRTVNGERIGLTFLSESKGTKTVFGLLAATQDALESGRTLVVDELDTSLHPMMLSYIAKLFQNREYNSKGAQLIFSTQNLHLMGTNHLRPDEIYLVEKDRHTLATRFTRLSNYRIKEQDGISKAYLEGRFDAIPRILGDF